MGSQAFPAGTRVKLETILACYVLEIIWIVVNLYKAQLSLV